MTTDHDLQESELEIEELATDEEVLEVPAEEEIEEPEFDPIDPPPKWDKRYKEVFSEWAGLERGREYQEAMLELYNKNQGYTTQVEQERAALRGYVQQWDQVISPYEQMIASTGATPDAFVRQALGLTMQLQHNPRETILRLAQGAGLDLNQLQQEQPYIDPQVKSLQDRLNAMQESWQQRERRQAQEYAQRVEHEVTQQIGAFADAPDESGSPLHPHLDAVHPIMAELIHGREAQRRSNPGLPPLSLDEAYERACKISPDIGMQSEAERRAKDVAARSAKAKKATEAAKRVSGKRTGPDNSVEDSVEDEIRKLWRKAAT
jgi:hypothetical protein